MLLWLPQGHAKSKTLSSIHLQNSVRNIPFDYENAMKECKANTLYIKWKMENDNMEWQSNVCKQRSVEKFSAEELFKFQLLFPNLQLVGERKTFTVIQSTKTSSNTNGLTIVNCMMVTGPQVL